MKAKQYHGVLLQPAAVLAVVGVLAVGEVLGHQPQGGGGEGSTDEVEHQHTFDLEEPKRRRRRVWVGGGGSERRSSKKGGAGKDEEEEVEEWGWRTWSGAPAGT